LERTHIFALGRLGDNRNEFWSRVYFLCVTRQNEKLSLQTAFVQSTVQGCTSLYGLKSQKNTINLQTATKLTASRGNKNFESPMRWESFKVESGLKPIKVMPKIGEEMCKIKKDMGKRYQAHQAAAKVLSHPCL
jgi:hypothetical protein